MLVTALGAAAGTRAEVIPTMRAKARLRPNLPDAAAAVGEQDISCCRKCESQKPEWNPERPLDAGDFGVMPQRAFKAEP